MKSNNKQSGTLAGHHNQPAGPATERYNMEDKEAIIEEVIAICKANKKNMYCDKYQLVDMIREVLKLYEN
jgi:hypothetical protein